MQSNPSTGHDTRAEACPRLPNVFRHLGKGMPRTALQLPVERLLQHVFASYLEQGELDMLAGSEFAVVVDDLGIRLGFSKSGTRLVVTSGRQPDVEIRGPLAAFLWLAVKRVDADTLFFHRHLVMEGDTELGLIIKNLLDATDLAALPPPLLRVMEWAADRVPAQPPGAGAIPG
ncbi:MAG: SCP2 sterol-binding domain-containing protein [Gammaproteobacteria bacterium]|nr:SCP2 sterol-binding domain-containing protein [Gammaproteobacteria bacterium]